MKTKLGEWLGNFRSKIGHTQTQMALELGFSANHLCAIEHGKKHISPYCIERVQSYVRKHFHKAYPCEWEDMLANNIRATCHDVACLCAISNGYVDLANLPFFQQVTIASMALKALPDAKSHKIFDLVQD